MIADRSIRPQPWPLPRNLAADLAVRIISRIERTRGASTSRLNGPGRFAIGPVVVGAACLLSTFELASVRAAQAANDAPVHAYSRPLRAAARFHTMTLTVLDDGTAKPLSDVEVTVLNYVEVRDYRFPTDSGGRLRFDYPYIGTVPALHIEARKDGYVPVRASCYRKGDPEQKPVDALTIRLRRGITMGGKVVYAGDRPVEGVTVVMTVGKYGPGKRPENPTGYEIYYEVPKKTGPDGRWRTDSVPPGAQEVHLQLIHPEFVMEGSTTLGDAGRSPALAGLLEQSDRQVLRKGAKITGRVVDAAGKPIAAARIVDSTRGLTFLDYMREAFTDDGGRFHLHFGRGENTRLTAQVRGYEAASLEFKPEPDTPPLEFRLKNSKGLKGRAVDPAGKPIAAASISLAGRSRDIDFLAYTDAEGRFEWDSAPERATYRAGAEGYVPIETISLAAGDKEAVVVLKPALDLQLRVVDAETGKGIDGFGVEIVTKVPGAVVIPRERQEGSYGTYSFSREPRGASYQFKVVAEGYAPARTRSVRDDERVVRELIKLRKEGK